MDQPCTCSGLRAQAMRFTSSAISRPSLTRSSACARNTSTAMARSSTFHAALPAGLATVRSRMFRASASISDFGTSKLACSRRPFSTCSFTIAATLRLSSSLRLDSDLAHAGPRRRRWPRRSALRELGIQRGQAGFGDLVHGECELRVLSGDFTTVIVRRERRSGTSWSRPPSCRRRPPRNPAASAFAQHHGEILRLCPPGNSTPSIVPVKSTRIAVPRRGCPRAGEYVVALPAQDVEGAVDVRGGHLDLRTPDRDLRRVADLDLGIHLESRRVLERVGRVAFAGPGLEARSCRPRRFCVPHGIGEALLHGFARSPPSAAAIRIAAPTIFSGTLPGRKPGMLHGPREPLQALGDLAFDVGDGTRRAMRSSALRFLSCLPIRFRVVLPQPSRGSNP